MNKLWNHVENLAPGLALCALVWLVTDGAATAALPILENEIVGAMVLVAFGYVFGTANAALARFLFTIPLMEELRWRKLSNLLRDDERFASYAASILGIGVSRGTLAASAIASRVESTGPQLDAQARRKARMVFHSLSGHLSSSHPGSPADELSHRRVEARLIRAGIIPCSVAAAVIASRVQANPYFSWLALALCGAAMFAAYLYRECTIAETLHYYLKGPHR